MSSNGRCFDIGVTISRALDRYLETADPFAGDIDPHTAGNGALMRLAPIPMLYADDPAQTFLYAGESTRTTHAAQEAIECSRLFALQLRQALLGASREEILAVSCPEPLSPAVQAIARGDYRGKSRNEIRGSGYCVDALEAALWCFWGASSFDEAVLLATNLGDDADTTAAICGQISGAWFGVQGIPESWLQKLVMRTEIEEMAVQLLALAELRATDA
ncbi:MAG: ADP-ribosylglycohydrolase family protein [Rhodocyclaceae bacterium]